MEKYVYWIWLSEVKGVPLQKKNKWIKEFGHAKKIYENAKDIGIPEDLSRALEIVDSNIKSNIKTLTPDHRLYKTGMPHVIYYQGTPFEGKQVAVVGTRNSSIHGKYYTEVICQRLIRDKICINSGLAKGIDITAHHYAIQRDMPTQAFLAHGLDQCYPQEHTWYKGRIVENGAVFSIYPLGTPPLRHHFLQRNQMMATFSDEVIVTEAPLRSGSLDTAKHALEQMKPVSTVEGTKSPKCAGNNHLLKNGAISLDLQAYYWNGPERIYLEAIRKNPMSLRQLKSEFHKEFDDLHMILWNLESHGWVRHKADGKWHYNGW